MYREVPPAITIRDVDHDILASSDMPPAIPPDMASHRNSAIISERRKPSPCSKCPAHNPNQTYRPTVPQPQPPTKCNTMGHPL